MSDLPREQIVAFRLASHHLASRLGRRALATAAGACGIQETPTGSAALALLARVDGLTPATFDRALTRDRTLVTLWSVRGAPYVVPTSDLAVFSQGALPLDAGSFKQALGGWADALARARVDPITTLEQLVLAARELLDGRQLNVNELRDQLYARIPALSRVQRPSGAHADMPEPLFRAVGTTGAVCIVANRGTDAELARTDQWLGDRRPTSASDRKTARAELARRFLHCYGPATAQQFAEWSQRSLADAKDAFAAIEPELVQVTVDRKRAWLLGKDEPALADPPAATGVRLLPVQDPFLQQRDRATLVPDPAARRKLWQPVRGPGGVLVDGVIAGSWRSRINRDRLELTVEPFGRLSGAAKQAIEAEADRIAPFRNCQTVAVRYAG
ncbi:MAG TPA: winged helix DNA-binding domain-containing protein [Natronosporangium sp.]